MTYTIIKSERKTIAIQLRDGKVIVRAPKRMSEAKIAKFVTDHESWINKKLNIMLEQKKKFSDVQPLSKEELRSLAEEAKAVSPRRVEHYASLLGVTYGKITIRNQRTRWGSCSSNGNLNFNCLLMLTPPSVLDCIVVHELCHRKEMNHSKKFYAEILKVFPDYYEWHTWLKENGEGLMIRSFPESFEAIK